MKSKTIHPNAAIAILRKHHVGVRALARCANVSPSTAHAWFAGASKPNDRARALIAAAYPEADAGSWDRRAENKKTGTANKIIPPIEPNISSPEIALEPDEIDLDAAGAPKALAIAQLRRLEGDVARARRAGDDVAIGKAEQAFRGAVLALAKLAGEYDQTEPERLVRSSAWRDIRRRTLAALEPWPEALAAVEAVLAREGA